MPFWSCYAISNKTPFYVHIIDDDRTTTYIQGASATTKVTISGPILFKHNWFSGKLKIKIQTPPPPKKKEKEKKKKYCSFGASVYDFFPWKFVTNLLNRDDLEVDRSAEGNYSTELYGNRAAQIIRWDKENKLAPPRKMAFTLTIALAGLTTRRKRQNSLKI